MEIIRIGVHGNTIDTTVLSLNAYNSLLNMGHLFYNYVAILGTYSEDSDDPSGGGWTGPSIASLSRSIRACRKALTAK